MSNPIGLKEAPGTLASYEGLGSVTTCGCGVVTLHLGALSLRLEIATVAQLETLLHEANQELRARAVLTEKTHLVTASSLTH